MRLAPFALSLVALTAHSVPLAACTVSRLCYGGKTASAVNVSVRLNGIPVQGATVEFSENGLGSLPIAQAITGADGMVRSPNLEPGSYIVDIEYLGYVWNGSCLEITPPSAAAPVEELAFDLKPAATTLTVRSIAGISLTDLGNGIQPVDWARYVATNVETKETTSIEGAHSGRFRFPDLLPGLYTLQVLGANSSQGFLISITPAAPPGELQIAPGAELCSSRELKVAP